MAVACHPDPSFVQFASAGKDGVVKLWGPHNASFGGDDENKMDGGETTVVEMDVSGDVAGNSQDSDYKQISVVGAENDIRTVSSTVDAVVNTGSTCDESKT
jgi:hypothetical protein